MPFVLYTDHQPLVHLHNMKIVCSRLARTVEELADYVFEIRYVPGHLNSAADALSRLNCKVPAHNNDFEVGLPEGLVLNGYPVPGGGDSLFISILRSLPRTQCTRKLPDSALELRQLLTDEILDNAARYKIKFDHESRKQIQLMRWQGQLPCLDFLLAASYLFEVKFFVYFWTPQPIIYQYDNYDPIIHLQCLSGIHFNPLIEVVDYILPSIKDCDVNTVSHGPVQLLDTGVGDQSDCESSDDDEAKELMKRLLFIDESSKPCSHPVGSLPAVQVSMGEYRLCAILDSGAEISLVSQSVLDSIRTSCSFQVQSEDMCDIVGFSGARTAVVQSVELLFDIGSYKMAKSHKFAVVSGDVFPHCFLLGIDFLCAHKLSVDLKDNLCKQNHDVVAELMLPTHHYFRPGTFLLERANPEELKFGISLTDEGIRFEIDSRPGFISQMSLLMDEEVIEHLQGQCPEIKLVLHCLDNDVQVKDWPVRIKSFAKHSSELHTIGGHLVYGDLNPVLVMPFKVVIGVLLTLHKEFAHVGQDKLLALLEKLMWHPSKYTITNDICSTCHQRQCLKESSTTIVPPTLKINSSYPFDLVVADVISMPHTCHGFIGCLVVVDHYSKWLSVVPIKNKKSATIVHAFNHCILPFLPRIPTSLLTDNGPEFASAEFCEWAELSGINHKFTTPYCPSSNGAVERVNRTIKNFLRSLVEEPGTWDEFLP